MTVGNTKFEWLSAPLQIRASCLVSQREPRVDLHMEKSKWTWLGYLAQMPPECLSRRCSRQGPPGDDLSPLKRQRLLADVKMDEWMDGWIVHVLWLNRLKCSSIGLIKSQRSYLQVTFLCLNVNKKFTKPIFQLQQSFKNLVLLLCYILQSVKMKAVCEFDSHLTWNVPSFSQTGDISVFG